MLKSILRLSVVLSVILFSAAAGKEALQDDAVNLVRHTIEKMNDGFWAVIEKINSKDPEYFLADTDNLYVFVYDEELNMIAHPVKPKLIGKNFTGKKDAAGSAFRDSIKIKALSAGEGWQEYIYQKPGDEGISFEKKATYFKTMEYDRKKYFICAGIYLR